MLNIRKIFGSRQEQDSTISSAVTGEFDVRAGRVMGSVRDRGWPVGSRIKVKLVRRGIVTAEVDAEPTTAAGVHRFSLPVNGIAESQEFLSDVTRVLAYNQRGDCGFLLLSGASGLELVREALGVPVEIICDIDFTTGGNSRDYTGLGWTAPGSDYTWTENDNSYLTLPGLIAPGAYALRLTCGATIHPKLCPWQFLEVFINDEKIAHYHLTANQPQFFELKFDSESFLGTALRLRFCHPDAARPSDLFNINDTRRLALSFRRVSIVRFTSPANQSPTEL